MTIQEKNTLVSCIVVTYNSESVIENCLSRLLKSDYSHLEIIVIDNASTDKTKFLLNNYLSKIHFIENSTNTGFAQAMNQGIHQADGAWILSLNPDTFVAPSTISLLHKAIQTDPLIGAVAPKLLSMTGAIDCAGIMQTPCLRFINQGEGEPDQGQFEKEQFVFGACGACALYRKSMLESIKIDDEYFDALFFAYKEDIDLAWRSRHRGWRCLYVPSATAQHKRRFPELKPLRKNHAMANWLRVIHNEISQWPSQSFRNVRKLSFRNTFYLLIKNFQRPNTLKTWFCLMWFFFRLVIFYGLLAPYVLPTLVDVIKNFKTLRHQRKITLNKL